MRITTRSVLELRPCRHGQLRSPADRDPALFLDLNPLPVIIDEIQNAPDLLPEIKRRVDKWRRERRDGTEGRKPLVWASGSNQIIVDRNVKESLAGRASFYTLHTLAEISSVP